MASTEIAIRHSTKSAARLPVAFKTRRNSSAAALAARAAHGRGFRPQNCGAVSRCSVRPGRMLTVARLPRFYNKFRLQSDRSTTNAERAAGRKLARLWAGESSGRGTPAAIGNQRYTGGTTEREACHATRISARADPRRRLAGGGDPTNRRRGGRRWL